MSHEIYIFGSAIRGEVTESSDIDVLVIPEDGVRHDAYPEAWSVYSRDTIRDYFQMGRLFAWHLHLESKCVYSPYATTFLATIGSPSPYLTCKEDIDDLESMLVESLVEIENETNSLVFELGLVHTALRDIAMSASWCLLKTPTFSRDAPYHLPLPCPLAREAYNTALLARHMSTRGIVRKIEWEWAVQSILNAPLTRWIDDVRRLL